MLFSLEKKSFKEILKLAIPVSIGQLGQISVGLADNLMVGHITGDDGKLGTYSLAASSFANGVFAIIMVFGIGVTLAITALVAGSDKNFEKQKIANILNHSIVVCTIIGLLFSVLLAICSPLLENMNQPEKVVELAIPYFNIISFSLIPLMIFMGLKQFSEGLSHTKEPMMISIGGNILNILLNYLLIYGKFGFPEMGLNGAGIATLISRVFMAFMMFLMIKNSLSFQPYYTSLLKTKYQISEFIRILKMGIPIGFQITFEVLAFAIASVMMGWLGAKEQAAHQVAIGLATATYLIASGLSTAATIKIGNYWNDKNFDMMRKTSKASLILVLMFMGSCAVIFMVFNQILPQIFSIDVEVISIASQLLIIAAFFQLFDGASVVSQGLLRGIEDVNMPTINAFIAYAVIGLPGAYILGFVFNLGANGIWYALSAGLIYSAVANNIRFTKLANKLQIKFK